MKILFVHQNFPAQFRHLAPALARQGHEVVALSMRPDAQEPRAWQGVRVVGYRNRRGTSTQIHPWAGELETKVIRAEACLRAAHGLDRQGFRPDAIVAHPGWGESLFLKDLWPQAWLGLYLEFFYQREGQDAGFDPEFPPVRPLETLARLRLKNAASLLHLDTMDAAISPTQWQASTFPPALRDRISVVHDGIDTELLRPNPAASVTLNRNLAMKAGDEVVTFVNRNLEPYRGYHIFMRALPEILSRRPQAHVLIVGDDGEGYGGRPQPERDGSHASWKEKFAAEVRSQVSDEQWSRVHFLGRIPYAVYIGMLQVSAVHVYWTYPFVLSWSLLEAMSAGATIVASDTAPVREVITASQTGHLVDFFDVDGLARQVCDALQAAPGMATGGAARALIRERYDLATQCLPRQLAWVHDHLG